jgi:hypothetical protein
VGHAAFDRLSDPRAWTRAAVEACLQHWLEDGARYARRLAARELLRDAADDLLALAARRAVPLRRRVQRPLPEDSLPALAAAFNRLDRADRRVLLAWARREPLPDGVDQRALAEHRASALQRLVARAAAHQRHRPPPAPGDGR